MARPFHQPFHAITDRPERRERLPVSSMGEAAAVGRMFQLADSVLEPLTVSPEVHGIASVTSVEELEWAHCLCSALQSFDGIDAVEQAKAWTCDRLEVEREIAEFAALKRAHLERRLALRQSLLNAALARVSFDARR